MQMENAIINKKITRWGGHDMCYTPSSCTYTQCIYGVHLW